VRPLLDRGQKQFPYTCAHQLPHRIYAAIPVVEIADDGYALRVRRPYSEINAGRIADRPQMRAKFFINFPVLSFAEQMQIDVAHDRTVLIGIPRELF